MTAFSFLNQSIAMRLLYVNTMRTFSTFVSFKILFSVVCIDLVVKFKELNLVKCLKSAETLHC